MTTSSSRADQFRKRLTSAFNSGLLHSLPKSSISRLLFFVFLLSTSKLLQFFELLRENFSILRSTTPDASAFASLQSVYDPCVFYVLRSSTPFVNSVCIFRFRIDNPSQVPKQNSQTFRCFCRWTADFTHTSVRQWTHPTLIIARQQVLLPHVMWLRLY